MAGEHRDSGRGGGTITVPPLCQLHVRHVRRQSLLPEAGTRCKHQRRDTPTLENQK